MSYGVEPGSVLDGRFRIDGVLNESGMATLFRALDLQTQQLVALKVPLMQYESDPVFFSQFQREETVAAALAHPAVVRVVAVDPAVRSRPYIVFELLEGRTLHALIQERQPMEIAAAIGIISRLCAALEQIHAQGVVHHDLKPGNIMIRPDGSLKILDFGLAATVGRRDRVSWLGSSIGTVDYLAPEQVKGKRGDPRTDIYALGVMLYQMTTGVIPFANEDPALAARARLTGDPVAPRTLNPAIMPELEEIMLHALSRDIDGRYASCAALKAELDDPQRVVISGREQRLQVPGPDRAVLRQALIVMLLLAVPLVAFGLLYWLSRGHGR